MIADKPDAGWNDPPMFSYDDQINRINSNKRTILNKRIVFPLNSDVNSPHHNSEIDPTAPLAVNPNIPPPPKVSIFTHLVTDVINSTEETQSPDAEENYPENILNKVLSILRKITEESADNIKKDEVNKKLDIMEAMWKQEKLKPDIHKKMLKLCQGLQAGCTHEVNHIYTGLMVDYPRLCSPWICGLRPLFS